MVNHRLAVNGACVRVRVQRFKEERLHRTGVLLECLTTRKFLRAIRTTKMIHNER